MREFYGWMKGDKDDDGELGTPKLPEAKSVRDLSKVMEDTKAFAVFRADDGSLTHALARLEADHQIEYLPTVAACESVLSALSPDALRRISETDLEALLNLRKRIDQLLEDRAKLLGDSSGTPES